MTYDYVQHTLLVILSRSPDSERSEEEGAAKNLICCNIETRDDSSYGQYYYGGRPLSILLFVLLTRLWVGKCCPMGNALIGNKRGPPDVSGSPP